MRFFLSSGIGERDGFMATEEEREGEKRENRTRGFLIAYEVKECDDKVKGLGVFAKQDIAKGTMIWRPIFKNG